LTYAGGGRRGSAESKNAGTDRRNQKQNDPPHGNLLNRTEPDESVEQQPDNDQDGNWYAQ
jgi:hypothetical protein